MTILISSLLLILSACQYSQELPENEYPRMIGDILFDPDIDDPIFKLCNPEHMAIQYYAYNYPNKEKTYAGEKIEILDEFKQKYSAETVSQESGSVRIRFLVNCEGKAGRFRIMGMDKNYQPKVFDRTITDQLLNITKGLKNWKPYKNDKVQKDYYQYLIFKISEGKILEILP